MHTIFKTLLFVIFFVKSDIGFTLVTRYCTTRCILGGQQGKLLTDMRVTNLFFDQEERLLAVGNDDEGLVIARFLDNGDLDMTFGQQGSVKYPVNALSSSMAKAVQLPNKQILAVYEKTLFKINPDGSLNTSFGEDGKINVTGVWIINQLSSNGLIVLSGMIYEDLTGHEQ